MSQLERAVTMSAHRLAWLILGPFSLALVALAPVSGQPPVRREPGAAPLLSAPKSNQSSPLEAKDKIEKGETEEEFDYAIEGEMKKGKRRVLTVDLGGGRTMAFVRIKAGTFQMGTPEGEEGTFDDERPQRKVEITRDFYLGKYEVTQAQYKAVVGETPSRFSGDQLPVEQVSWEHAVKFCEALTKKTKRTVELPTEAQWEYACRAGTTTLFHFGSKLNGDLANCDGTRPYGTGMNGPFKGKTTEVGSYPANPWGLHDMSGNVWEWCRDFYGPYDKVAEVKDPERMNKDKEDRRIVRGGSWYNGAWSCRSATRYRYAPVDRTSNFGFRVCLRTE